MRRFAAGLFLLLLSTLAVAQDFPQGVIIKSPLIMGGASVSVLPFTNGGEVTGQFNPSSQELVEGFDTATLNITNTWIAPTTGGGGNAVAATNAVSDTVLSTGTIANGWSKLQSIKTFIEDNPGYMFFQTQVNLSPAPPLNACFMFGYATVPTNPVCGAMATNGAVFETTAAGKLLFVVYNSSSRTVIADLSVVQTAQRSPTVLNGTQPLAYTAGCQCTPQFTDTNSHKYIIYYRGDNIIVEVEGPQGVAVPVAYVVSGAAGPDVNVLPLTYLAVAGPNGLAQAATLQINQVTVARTSGKPPSVVGVTSPSAENTRVFKSFSGNLLSAYATLTTGGPGFLIILNSATAPGDGAVVPLDCVPIAASPSTVSINYNPGAAKHYNTGITAVLTSATTCFTKTTGAGMIGYISGSVQ